MINAQVVDWSSLPDVYGDTEAIPAALEEIRSGDDETRYHAYHRLAERVVTQGSRCTASAVVAGLLIEIVADPDAPSRHLALQVLLSIAIGDEEFWFYQVPDATAHRNEINRKLKLTRQELEQEIVAWVAAATNDGERRARQRKLTEDVFEEDLDAEAADMAAYDAVRAGLPAFQLALQAPDPAVRLHAAHLLYWFPEDGQQSVPALTRIIAGDPDPFVAATACVAAGRCARQPDTSLIRALQTRVTSENLAEKWSAVIGLGFAALRPDRVVIEELYRCMFEAPGPVPNWPYFHGDIARMATVVIGQLDSQLVGVRVAVLARRIIDTSPSDKRFMMLGALLEAACPTGIRPENMTGPQRKAIDVILETSIWDEGPIARQILSHYGLPASADVLRTWLS